MHFDCAGSHNLGALASASNDCPLVGAPSLFVASGSENLCCGASKSTFRNSEELRFRDKCNTFRHVIRLQIS